MRRFPLALAALVFLAAPAQAAPVTFQINGLVFDDGGTASGTFVLDTVDGTSGVIVSADITTTGGSAVPGAHYVADARNLFNGNGSDQYLLDGLYRIDLYSVDGPGYALILYVHPPLLLDASNPILVNYIDGANTFECTQSGDFQIRGAAIGSSPSIAPPPAPPADQLQDLIDSTLMTSLPANVQGQLDQQLGKALEAVEKQQPNAPALAANHLQAFVNNVRSNVLSRKLSCTQAKALVSAAQSIVAALGQPPLAVWLPCGG